MRCTCPCLCWILGRDYVSQFPYVWYYVVVKNSCIFLGLDIRMCFMNEQFELLEIVFNFIYVHLEYNEINIAFTAGSMCLCGVCSLVVVFSVSVWLSWYPMWMRCLW